jgi:flagellar basal-body rod modification protein FlgD
MATSSTSGVSSIGQDQFLQLLVSQLQNQDPLNPVSPQDFITQLSSLNTVEGLTTLNANFSQLLQLEQLTNGSSLIGKTVEYTPTGGGAALSGTVDSLSVQNGNFVLQIGGKSVNLSQITSVK